MTTRLAYDRFEYSGEYPYDYGTPGEPQRVIFSDQSRGEWITAEAVGTALWRQWSRVTGGLEVRRNLSQRLKGWDPLATYLDRRAKSSIWAAFLQQEVWLGPVVSVNAGLRHDRYSTFGGTTNPRVAVLLRPGVGTTLKLLHGRAFRAPNAWELFYEGGGNKPNPNLDPERIASSEVVLEQKATRNIGLSVGVYQQDLRDLIGEVEDQSDGQLVFRNLGRTRTRGLESAIHGRWATGWAFRANYSRVRAEDARTGEELSNAPRHLANLAAEVPIVPRKFFLGTRLSYQGSRKTLIGERTPGAWLWDLSVLRPGLFRGIGLSGGITNLLDADHFHPGSEEHAMDQIRQDGRQYWLTIGYRRF